MKRTALIALVAALAACNLTNEKIAPDAGVGGDASVIGVGGAPGCDAAYCCTSDADIPPGLGCGACGHDTLSTELIICDHGKVVCDPSLLGGDRREVVAVEEWSNGIGDCVAGWPSLPDGGGCYNGCTDPEVVAHVEGQDDCYKFDFLVDRSIAYYGKEVEFTLTLTNACSTPIDLHSGSGDWLTIYILTHGVACCPSRDGLPAGQHVAILPMDGWDGAEWNRMLKPNEWSRMILPWHPDADGMVNPKDAPEGLYDVYAMPPAIKRDAGDWHGPLSKFLAVRVVNQ